MDDLKGVIDESHAVIDHGGWGAIRPNYMVHPLVEGRPWAEWGRSAKPMTQNALARQLDKFQISPGTIRLLRKYFIPDFTLMKALAKIASTGAMQFLIGSYTLFAREIYLMVSAWC